MHNHITIFVYAVSIIRPTIMKPKLFILLAIGKTLIITAFSFHKLGTTEQAKYLDILSSSKAIATTTTANILPSTCFLLY